MRFWYLMLMGASHHFVYRVGGRLFACLLVEFAWLGPQGDKDALLHCAIGLEGVAASITIIRSRVGPGWIALEVSARRVSAPLGVLVPTLVWIDDGTGGLLAMQLRL